MKRAVLYSRVSTSEQASEGYSLADQLRKGRQYADLKDWEVVQEFRDAGVSGAKGFDERPEGIQLLDAARANLFDVAIFTKLDRFARSVIKALEDFQKLEDLGIEVVFVEDDIDTSTAQGRLFRTLLAAFAEFEREQIRDRNMAGRYAKASTGAGWATGRVPYGYESDEYGSLHTQEQEAHAVKLIFQHRAAGRSLRAITDTLDEHNIRPRDGGRFSTGSISHYLKQTAYRGDGFVRNLSPSGGAAPEAFNFPAPAIVDRNLWGAANNVKTKTQRTYALGSRIRHEHADGTISTMFGQARRTKDGWLRVYRCSGSRQGGCDGLGVANGNRLTAIDADWIEGAVAAEDADTIVILYRSLNARRPNIRLETPSGEVLDHIQNR